MTDADAFDPERFMTAPAPVFNYGAAFCQQHMEEQIQCSMASRSR